MISLLSQLAITLIWLWVGAKGFTIYYQKYLDEISGFIKALMAERKKA